MTPAEITTLREDFDFTVDEFSRLIGVAVATTYRWQKLHPGDERTIDPLQVNILNTLARIRRPLRKRVGVRIKHALTVNTNPLYAFGLLLRAAFKAQLGTKKIRRTRRAA